MINLSEVRKILKELKKDIKSVQKHFPDEYIRSLSYQELLANCHPLYRERYKKRLIDAGIKNVF
ncbi:MAG: hypothetical protein ACLFUH_10425 [Bacteroidales bacterium]